MFSHSFQRLILSVLTAMPAGMRVEHIINQILKHLKFKVKFGCCSKAVSLHSVCSAKV